MNVGNTCLAIPRANQKPIDKRTDNNNGKANRDKRTNNNLQNTTQKT